MSWEATEEQKAAIKYDGNLVAIAKPGSGKTYVMSEKIRSILPDLPRHKGVIAISYTNKASAELKKRSSKDAVDTKSSFFGTMDKFCDSEIIIPFLSQLWGKPEKDVSISRLQDLTYEEQENFSQIDSGQFSIDNLRDHLDIIKIYFLQGRIFIESSGALALYVAKNSTSCKKYLLSRYTHIFIDEYQDSGSEQHQLMLELCELGLTATAVGDADQSIFAFSGKSSEYLLDLAKDKKFKQFPITYNHRSHASIVNYSQRFFDDDAILLSSDEVRVFEKCCQGNQKIIAKWIDSIIPVLVKRYEVENLSDIAILYRGGLTGDLVNESLSAPHQFVKPHPLEESFSLWGNLFCKLLTFRFNNNLTAEEIITSTVKIASQEDIRSLRRLIKDLKTIDVNGLYEKIEEIAKALIPNAESESALHLLRQCIDSKEFSIFEPPKENEIQIMTLHKSKGLEFDIVFHLDLYEWKFPAKRPDPNNDFDHPIFSSFDQDVNLHYVGVTRARKACFLCTSSRRTQAHWTTGEPETKNGSKSEFLLEKSLLILRELTDL